MIELKLFAIFLLGGIVLASFWGIVNFIKIMTNKNKIIMHIIEIIYAVLMSVSVFIMLITYNYGEFRFYLAVALCLGFIIERRTLGILFVKLYQTIYNKSIICVKAIKQTKIAKRVLK